ncbi:QcrA and Rieske domain-containing protein [Paraliomyxa miuraensis]|uniref:QcrA and Rieske domain-containing protein n=1 Tax=Paraliomyxa miuraensis TaxID=376150 RepID=UPI0022579BB5|nr:ubiquinol-cytochrome c reductase iron-sulfur subunit [Paraliomyxa miuraensis]MCX4243861.1 ubiquinol-cytochrome c reductase iron-sulfur subunit [Paraliomyxa miuraensis]
MPDSPSHPLARRAFVGGGVGLVLVGCAGAAPRWEPKGVPVGEGGLVELKLRDFAPLVTPGGMVAVRPATARKPVLVQRLEGESVRVLSLRCTHLGCTVRWDDDAQLLVCPCHGSKFDDRGSVLEGPAKQALPVHRSELDGSTVRFWVS